ncbi:hypothetical protein CMV_022175 [Castanea mollissima]|uniref:Uncharacterized protein n=1 Tax=Castanea mollissima TaxID=60419 RepID=A0A8J4QS11_9ROSI|nr:hypothetical protein CMV_022175 [Castanea mollissima]
MSVFLVVSNHRRQKFSRHFLQREPVQSSSSSRTRVRSTIPIRALDPQKDEETEKPNVNDKTRGLSTM